MLIERIYDEDLAQASYFIGCQRTGQALVVDPGKEAFVRCLGCTTSGYNHDES